MCIRDRGNTQCPELLEYQGHKYQIHGNLVRPNPDDAASYMGITYCCLLYTSESEYCIQEFRRTGAIEQDADIVLALYRDGYYNLSLIHI